MMQEPNQRRGRRGINAGDWWDGSALSAEIQTAKCSRCSEVEQFSLAVFSKNLNYSQKFVNTKVVGDSRCYKFCF